MTHLTDASTGLCKPIRLAILTVLFAAVLLFPAVRAQTPPAIFINLSTGQVASGATPTAAGTTTIAAPGAGWEYSAAAPVAGTTWNVIQRPNPFIGTNSTSTVGQYVCNSADNIALASATGGATSATLTLSLDIQDLEGNTTRTEPNTGAGGNTVLGPAALMNQCWRIYRGGNGTIHRIAGLTPGANYYLYAYGTTNTAGQGCKFILDAANVPGGNGIITTFLDIRGGNAGNVFSTDGTNYSVTAPAVANVASTASDNHSWGRLHAVVDSTGVLTFRTAKNGANSQYLNGYQLMPYPLATIAIQPPPNPVATIGSDISFAVSATGEGSLTYQWRKDGQPIDININPSAATATLSLSSVQTTDAGTYDLQITNPGGTLNSNAAVLTATTDILPPSIQNHPLDTSASVGQNASFSVLANGTSPLTYVWEKSVDGVNFSPVGTNSPLLSLPTVQTSDAGRYRVTVTNSANSAISDLANLTVAPVILTQPVGGSVPSGSSRSITVIADVGAGSPETPTYVWKRNNTTISDDANISGSSTGTLQFSTFTLANSGLYTVTVSNSAGSVTTTAVHLGTPTTHATTRFPASGATLVNRDTTLRVTFTGGTPVVGSTGRIRLYNAANNDLLETLNLATAATVSQRSVTDVSNVTYRYLGKSIGGNTYKYLPVIVAGDTATITFSSPSLLSYGQTYYVKMDAGTLLDSTGATYPEIDDTTTWRFTVKPSGPAANATILRVAANGSGDFATVQGAIENVPTTNAKRVTILVAPGDYYEYAVIRNRPFVTLRGDGASASATRIAYLVNNNVYNLPPASSHLGARAVFTVDASPDFVADNLTIHNLTGKGFSQAEAIVTRSGSPRCLFNNVRVLSLQDTMLPDRIYVKDSYIEGDVDFMWGGGLSYYENCELKAMNSGYYAQYRTGSAASYGGIYVNCRFTAASGLGAGTQVYNRINPVDYPHAQMVLVDCAVGPHVKNNPWQLDGGATTAPTIRLWEYKTTDLSGTLLDVSGRPTFNAIATAVGSSTVLPNQQIDQATADFYRVPSNVFDGWVPVVPPVPSAFDAWIDTYELEGDDALAAADPDFDGMVNLLEYALATSPVASDAASAYSFGRDGDFLTLSFDHPADARLIYTVVANDALSGE